MPSIPSCRFPQLTLYHFASCPFCIRVRKTIEQIGLDIELKDVLQHPKFREELLEGGGSTMVPCLKITRHQHTQPTHPETQWLYESADIIQYLIQLAK